MHPMQKSPPNLGHVYAPRAKPSPESEARFCTPCIFFHQIQGTLFCFFIWFSSHLFVPLPTEKEKNE